MNETSKLMEAQYFLIKMQEEVSNIHHFVYNVSAFLSAARSVLQYAMEEAKKNNAQNWYDTAVSTRPILAFFKEKRDVNIHQQPINVNRRTTATISGVARISSSLQVTATDNDGKVIAERLTLPENPSPLPQYTTEIQHKFVFNDWKGPEGVIDLCKKYISELNLVIKEGRDKGVLTKDD